MGSQFASPPLIAGAGPVGLAAALFLRRQGVAARVIERRETPSTWSRALAVNPRTLDLLEPTGVTDKMLALGLRIRGMQFHRDGRIVVTMPFAGLPNHRPFMIGLSQAMTERLLADAFIAAGGEIERGVELSTVANTDNGVTAELKHTRGDANNAAGVSAGRMERLDCPWLLAADGARSVARGALGLAFEGSTFSREWHLADVPLDTDMAADHGHVYFLPGGRFVFCLRVIDAQHPPDGPPLWRVMGNMPDPLSRLPTSRATGPVAWVSRFVISHRVAEKLSVGRVFLAGDAAHVHSPVGARGMNLGIEDAWNFAEAVRTGRLDTYGPARHAIDRRVVRNVEFVSRLARGESPFARLGRRIMPTAVSLPLVRRRMLSILTGLDHPAS